MPRIPEGTPDAPASQGDAISFVPIGYVRSPFREKKDAPRQPAAALGIQGRLELLPGRGFDHALSDIEGWEYLWVLFSFHHNEGWRPKVLPPRSSGKRRGVFSTRSPHRPNPLGLSVVRLERVEGLVLHVANIDMLDGSPILDIKPYVPYTDALPQARTGWLDDESMGRHADPSPEGAPKDPLPSYEVRWSDVAEAQATWLRETFDLDVRAPAVDVLSLGPQPHPYRRIRPEGSGFRLAAKEWRYWFRVEGKVVTIERMDTGYRPRDLQQKPELHIHRAFVSHFGPPDSKDNGSLSP